MLMSALLAISPHRAMAVSAQPEPEVLVAQVYHRLIAAERSSKGYEPPETFYTPRLKALVAASRRQAAGEAPCGLDFIFWINGQDERNPQFDRDAGSNHRAGPDNGDGDLPKHRRAGEDRLRFPETGRPLAA